MQKPAILTDSVVNFFSKQHFVIVSTIDNNGCPHASCKGVIQVNTNGEIYLLDLYKGKTHENLNKSTHISITAVDEHKFRGYCLKGIAKIVKAGKLESRVVQMWEEKVTSRITHRMLKNIHGEKGHPSHPEALLPKPEYIIFMKVEDVVNLTPPHIK